MGTVDDWLFSNVRGSSPPPRLRAVAIDPTPVEGLTYASAYETSPLGRVTSRATVASCHDASALRKQTANAG
jgi:hypothetical protein